MGERPTIETERLVLRPFTLADAPAVQRIVGDRQIAASTLSIPHPYEEGMAEEWIETHQERYERGEMVSFAITGRADNTLIGAIGMHPDQTHAHAQIGYWLGKSYWNQGYVTEAAGAVVRYGFEVLGLERIFASHFGSNLASGRVLQKVGMSYEGRLRRHIKKWDVFEDVAQYGILRGEWSVAGGQLSVKQGTGHGETGDGGL